MENIYLDGKWHQNLTIEINEKGLVKPTASIGQKSVLKGSYIPTLVNYHSHSFQYAMAGLGEYFRGDFQEDFWSWRKAMYHLAANVNPKQLNAICKMLYSEMKKNGYDSVVEFQYLHHDKNGARFSNLEEMSLSIIAAAEEVGISLILCPVYYHSSDFGKPATHDQVRFTFKDPDEYLNLVTRLKSHEKNYKNLKILSGVHSIRACPVEHLNYIFASTSGDFHLHIAEQIKEINSCKNYYGTTPVNWVLNTLDQHERLQLIHATHLSEDEIKRLAKSKAHVILCPTTEANLGDGSFELNSFVKDEGLFSIGSDSHVCLSPFNEMKTLDFSQRLKSKSRSYTMGNQTGEVGDFLYDNCTNYRKTTNYKSSQNLIKLNQSHPLLNITVQDKILSVMVSCFEQSMISDILCLNSGKLTYIDSDEQIKSEFFEVMRDFRA